MDTEKSSQSTEESAAAAAAPPLATVIDTAPRRGRLSHKPGCVCPFCRPDLRKAESGVGAPQSLHVKAKRAKGGPGSKSTRGRRLKEERFAQAIANPNSPTFGNVKQSAIQAGYSPGSANFCGQRLYDMERVQDRIRAVHASVGITDELLARKALEGLDAMQTEFAKFEGKITDSRDTIDFATRHKYLETAHRVRGEFPRDLPQAPAALVFNIGQGIINFPSVEKHRRARSASGAGSKGAAMRASSGTS